MGKSNDGGKTKGFVKRGNSAIAGNVPESATAVVNTYRVQVDRSWSLLKDSSRTTKKRGAKFRSLENSEVSGHREGLKKDDASVQTNRVETTNAVISWTS